MKNKLKTKEEMVKFYNEMIEICEKELNTSNSLENYIDMLHIRSYYQRKLDEINNKKNITKYSDMIKESSKLIIFLLESFNSFLSKFCSGEIDIKKDYEKEYFEILYSSLENEMVEFKKMIEKI